MKFFLIIFLVTSTSFAINYGKVSGRIVNKQTKQPIENVNVYIAKTTIGASTNNKGEFLIEKISPGRYTLILSHLSYENQQVDIIVKQNIRLDLSFELSPKPIVLPEIDVADKFDDEWEDNFDIFRKSLLGTTWFADGCEIMNPYYVSFEKNNNGRLFAFCDVPLEIENRSLGYYITYFLEHFEYKFDTTKYAGLPYFEEMTSEFSEDSLVWRENRIEAYMGSVRHFLRALSEYYDLVQNDSTLQNSSDEYFSKHGFVIFINKAFSTIIGKQFVQKNFNASSVLAPAHRPNELFLICEDEIQIEYFKEYQELNYDPQISYIKTHADSVYFDKSGRYHDGFKLQTMGYMYKQRLAEMLPFEYEPSDSVIFNTDFR